MVRELAALREQKQWSAADARTVLAEWKRSGEPLWAFSRRHRLVPQRLAWWRKRLAVASSPSPLTLVPVTVRAPSVERPVSVKRSGEVALSIDVGCGGVRLDVMSPESIPPAWLAALVADLTEGAA